MVAPVHGAARSSNYPVRAADVDPKLHCVGSVAFASGVGEIVCG